MTLTKILIVDDEVNLTKMLKLNLEETGRYQVMTINQGKEALSAALEFNPDLVLLDIMMPDIQGNEIAEQLLADPQLERTKIVFLTAIVTKTEVPEAGKTIAGRKFLAKPIKTEELVQCIEEVLSENDDSL